ncbi:MAG: tRNA 2-thiouridine(34) synthase MnmA [Gemmatimonadetes bacterium]|nr:tRNA 2-thiouridine(34) synthase MnmA [Gemmatimonadota bacterium]
MKNSDRVLVAMSGGVDSSIAAALLVEAGYEVIGATMKTFCYKETAGPSRTCCGLDGIQDARRVCDHLGIPHYVFDVEEEFTRDVIDDFVSEYAAGRTPNPCVRCNSNTKFRDLLRRGRMLGCTAIASGHYVRAGEDESGAPALFRAADPQKDQSYFLWGLPRSMLPTLLFPLGSLRKSEVRSRARKLGLVTADKPESQEICFVPTGDYAAFVAAQLGEGHAAFEQGAVVTTTGRKLGVHHGYAGYTVGQRRRLPGGFSRPLYVVATRPATREVVVGTEEELYAGSAVVGEVNWLTHRVPEPRDEILVQIRHRAPAVPARITPADGTVELRFEEPQRAVTPGQSAVFYAGERVLGGGRIVSGSAGTEPFHAETRRT